MDGGRPLSAAEADAWAELELRLAADFLAVREEDRRAYDALTAKTSFWARTWSWIRGTGRSVGAWLRRHGRRVAEVIGSLLGGSTHRVARFLTAVAEAFLDALDLQRGIQPT